jgi:hypothetical protein
VMGPFFSFWAWGGGNYFLSFPSLLPMCSQHVLIMFPWGSPSSHEVPQVPKLFPRAFPIAPQFYPIWFAQSSTLMYWNWKGRLFRNAFASILHLGVQRGASIG